MRDEILANLNEPNKLEKLYRANKIPFKKEFNTLYPTIKGNAIIEFWNERLNYESDEINWGTKAELFFVIIASVLAGIIAKLPALLHIDEEFFYTRNIGFIIFPALTAYFAWKNQLAIGKVLLVAGATVVSLFFINFLPVVKSSDTMVLSCIHLVLVLWSILGFVYVGNTTNNNNSRLGYLKYNGDLVVMTTLILISGALMTIVTLGLFKLIGFKIEKFYFDYVGIFGLAAAPIIGTYLTQTNPQLVGKVSPVIAKIFSPLVLVMLLIYLVAIIYAGRNPYNDREFLLIFNALLIGVMAIIFFSVADTSRRIRSRPETWILFLLCLITVVVNCIALSAISFRIYQGGITPNRAAVLGSNVLILINLLLVTVQLFKVLSSKADLRGVGQTIASFLPFYIVWASVVTFLFPFLFGFK